MACGPNRPFLPGTSCDARYASRSLKTNLSAQSPDGDVEVSGLADGLEWVPGVHDGVVDVGEDPGGQFAVAVHEIHMRQGVRDPEDFSRRGVPPDETGIDIGPTLASPHSNLGTRRIHIESGQLESPGVAVPPHPAAEDLSNRVWHGIKVDPDGV